MASYLHSGSVSANPALQVKEVTETMPTPLCFDNATQWRLWLEATLSVAPSCVGRDVFNFCRDCTPEYKEAMMDEDRCAYEVTFRDVGGEVMGVRMTRKRKTEAVSGDTTETAT